MPNTHLYYLMPTHLHLPPHFLDELTGIEQTNAQKKVTGGLRKQETTKMLNRFPNVLGLAKSFQLFLSVVRSAKSQLWFAPKDFSSKCFMLVYFKENISLVFLGLFTLSSLDGFQSLFNVQDAYGFKGRCLSIKELHLA